MHSRTLGAGRWTLALFTSLAACGPDEAVDRPGQTLNGANDTISDPGSRLPFACEGAQSLTAGHNAAFYVRGNRREVIVDLPTAAARTPLPVIFAWHGVGDTAQNFHAFLTQNGVRPDADPEWPFILVLPQGLRLSPLSTTPAQGMEWAIFEGAFSYTDNIEAALFETVLGCLQNDVALDDRRIYMMGFSGGAILSNMLHSRYPQHIPAVFAMSGAWFNDPNQRANVNTGGFVQVNLDWDPLSPADGGIVLQTRGGVSDSYAPITNFEIINFDYCGQQAVPFLQHNNRVVIDCVHTGGHRPHPLLAPRVVVEMFKQHAVGTPSPYATGLPAGFPDSCTLH